MAVRSLTVVTTNGGTITRASARDVRKALKLKRTPREIILKVAPTSTPDEVAAIAAEAKLTVTFVRWSQQTGTTKAAVTRQRKRLG